MKNHHFIFFPAILVCLWGQPLAAQNNETLDNAAVIELHKLGLGDAVIVEKIKTSLGKYDVSLDGLKQLKGAGISDEVIRNMIATTSTGQVTGGQITAGDVNDPKSPHDAGIWLCEEKEGKRKMIPLEPSVYNQTKHSAGLFMAYGATAKTEAVLRSAHANVQTGNRRPVFYFYFEQTRSGLSQMQGTITSPNEFVLAQFRMDVKNNLRKLVVGQINAYSGSQIGPEDKSLRSFDFERAGEGTYKVQPKEDLANGEYGFFYAGPASGHGGKILDFGIQGSPETEPKKSTAGKSKTTKGGE